MTEEKYKTLYQRLLIQPEKEDFKFWNRKFVSAAQEDVRAMNGFADNTKFEVDKYHYYEKFQINLNDYKKILTNPKEREVFLLINKDNICFESFALFSNDENQVKLDVMEIIFQICCESRLDKATKVIKIHNHPSGNTNFSIGDEMSTFELSMLFRKCGVELIDSMLYSNGKFYSMAKIDEYLPPNRKILRYQASDVVLETIKTDYPFAQMQFLLPDYQKELQKNNKGNHLLALERIIALSLELQDEDAQNLIADSLIEYGNFIKMYIQNKNSE